MKKAKRTVKQFGCERCGPVETLLRLVIVNGWPRIIPYNPAMNHDPPAEIPTNLFYCGSCRLLVATTEEEAKKLLGLQPEE